MDSSRRQRGFMAHPPRSSRHAALHPPRSFFSSDPCASLAADPPPVVDVEGQPLAANAERLVKARFLKRLRRQTPTRHWRRPSPDKDAKKVQETLDKHVLFLVNINPESRVKVARGPAEARLQQAGWTPVLVKVVNESTVKKPLRILSPQSGYVSSAGRNERNLKDDPKIVERFLEVEVYKKPPLTEEFEWSRGRVRRRG